MAKPLLTNNDFCRASKRLKCDVASVKAVAEVESRGAGFYSNGFPTLLFERHVFRKYTDGKYNKSHPHLSGSQGNYGKAGQNQRNKFNEAYALDPIAAIKACSWGKFQVMGFNWKVAGYSGVVDFFNAMQRDEGEHLNAFIGFVIGNRLDDEIRHKDWAGFAYGYNGAGYKANKYDTAMARAYAKFAKEKIDCSDMVVPPVVKPVSDEAISAESTTTTVEQTTVESSTGESAVATTTQTTNDVTLNAPQGMGSVQTSTKMVIGGIAVPPFLVAAIEVVKGWISDGIIDIKTVAESVVNLIRVNFKYVLILLGVLIGVVIIKKICREIIFLVTVISHAIPGWNSVTVTAPEPVEKKSTWKFW